MNSSRQDREGPSTRLRSILRVALTASIVLSSAQARAELTVGCPRHVYLGNDPSDDEGPDWSDIAQGLANDGGNWFFTNRSSMGKYTKNWRPINRRADPGKLLSIGFPANLAALGINHFGDPDYYQGYVFVPFEGEDNVKAMIAAFRSFDLRLVDWVDVTEHQHKAGWVAIHPVEQMLYTSVDTLVAGTPLIRYNLDVGKIDNGTAGDFLSPTTPVDVLDKDGRPVVGKFTFIQGGVFTPWADLYLGVGKAGQSASDTRGGIHLFRRTADGSAFQLIESSENVSVRPGTSQFAYEYHPGRTGWFGQEPEGIDWFNQDNDSGARYEGQLHAILLDNQADDDNIWLKHYAVDYAVGGCIGADEDTDDDGVPDLEEVYEDNTNPLIGDSGGDDNATPAPCTVCDDPADAGRVSWCAAVDCIPGAPPQATTPTGSGYCPAMVGRIDAGSYTDCATVTEVRLSGGVKYWASQCDEGLLALTEESDCAYLLPNRTLGALDKVGDLGAIGLYGLFGPTSMAYPIPGTTNLWYQFFEHGVVINNHDGTNAYYIAQSNRWPVKERWKAALLADEVKERKLYPTASVGGSGSNKRIAYFTGTETSPSAAIVSLNRVNFRDPGYIVDGEILSKYMDYDPAVTDPDVFDGYLGVPLGERTCGDSTCTWEYQTFQNGVITTDGITATVSPSGP